MRIGIDLGGTKTEILVLDDQGDTRFSHRVPTDKTSYEAVIRTIVGLVEMAETKVAAEIGQACSVGVGIPGALDNARRLVKNANTVVLNGKPLEADLSEVLSRPVRLANDANCFALSEAVDGAGAGAEIVFGVIVGTGCGGGLVIQQQVINGCNGLTGEWGHNRLNDCLKEELPGAPCYCGKMGCVETWVSGSGVANHYHQATQQSLTCSGIAALARQGDPVAKQHIARLAHRLARGLAQIINIIDPHVIVLGGGVSNIKVLYEQIPALWNQWTFSDVPVTTLLKQAEHGDASGVRGAAWLWGQSK